MASTAHPTGCTRVLTSVTCIMSGNEKAGLEQDKLLQEDRPVTLAENGLEDEGQRGRRWRSS